MDTSRRHFLQRSVVTAGAVLFPSGCSRGRIGEESSSGASDEEFRPAYLALEESGELERREEALWRMLSSCECCPRSCGANRLVGERGVCSSTARLRVYSAGPHFGEEPELVGEGGSGTIFFSNCNLLCCFCQNWEINHRGDGGVTSHRELAGMMLGLQRRGCRNINLVTPSHVVPHIVKALRIAIPRGLEVPLVYNTGGYDSLKTVEMLDGIVDIYLPDFKYQDGELAARYSSGASDYPEVAARAIKEMYRQVGHVVTDREGNANRGLMIRHLVMPHDIAGTGEFARWVAEDLSPKTYVNLMAQYRPEHRASEYPKISRRLTGEEWRRAVEVARSAGLENLHT